MISYPPANGLCSESDETIDLFLSKYAEPFDKEDYKFSFPDATPVQIEEAKDEHAINHVFVTTQCKKICDSCVFKTECLQWALESSLAVYGVVGGLTEAERLQVSANGESSSPHIAMSTDSVDILEMVKMLSN